MAFQKYTAPPPPPPKPKPHVKFVRTVIQFTEDGLAHLGEIAGKLREATHVHLWHDAATNQVAITPAPPGDKDAFPIKNGKIQAKNFFEFAHIQWPVKQHSKHLEPHDGGVKLTVGSAGSTAPAKRSAQVTPIPKKSSTWKPGDPMGRGRKSKAQIDWLATEDGKKWLAAQGK